MKKGGQASSHGRERERAHNASSYRSSCYADCLARAPAGRPAADRPYTSEELCGRGARGTGRNVRRARGAQIGRPFQPDHGRRGRRGDGRGLKECLRAGVAQPATLRGRVRVGMRANQRSRLDADNNAHQQQNPKILSGASLVHRPVFYYIRRGPAPVTQNERVAPANSMTGEWLGALPGDSSMVRAWRGSLAGESACPTIREIPHKFSRGLERKV
jgi:hypothetical protein